MAKVERPQTLDHLRSQKQQRIKYRNVCMNPNLIEAAEELVAEVRMAEILLGAAERMADLEPDNVPKALKALDDKKAELETAQKKVKDASVKFVFQSIGRKRYDALITDHPMTEAQKTMATEMGASTQLFNIETFPFALMEQCLIEPALNPGELTEWMGDDTWNSSEIMDLFACAMEVNNGSSVVRMGNE